MPAATGRPGRLPAGMAVRGGSTATTAMSAGRSLPSWRSVLAVCAHLDDESFGLGAVLDAFGAQGARLAVLCLTHGESSTLHGVGGDLHQVRAGELRSAAAALGVEAVELSDYPDGALADLPAAALARQVLRVAVRTRPDGLLVFDDTGVTGHPDHVQATRAALVAADAALLPVLAWTLPQAVAATLNQEFGTAFRGRLDREVDLVVPVDRDRQRHAVRAHASQALPGSVLWRRLELLAHVEHLRWLRHPDRPPASPTT